MELWRARIETDDTSGQLAEIAGALGCVGANIVSLDVHTTGASRVADDLVVAVDGPLDAAAFDELLAPLDAELADLRRADAHELVDPVTQAIEAAGRVVRAQSSVEALAAAITQVVPVELAHVRPAIEGLPLTGVAAQALAEGRAVLGVGAAAARSDHLDAGTDARVLLRDGGEVRVRALLAGDEPAFVRMHARCSPATTQRRYFSGMRTPPPALLRLLMEVDGHRRVGLVAAIGSELVGVAHLDLHSDGTGEVAVLVEDAHQRRGIGTTLLRRCVHAAASRGVGVLTAVCLAENTAFPTLVAGCGYDTTSTLDDGLRHLAFPVPAPQPEPPVPRLLSR